MRKKRWAKMPEQEKSSTLMKRRSKRRTTQQYAKIIISRSTDMYLASQECANDYCIGIQNEVTEMYYYIYNPEDGRNSAGNEQKSV